MATPSQIGILTFHRCINYGSYWQARCLLEGLRWLGHDAVLMDHRSPRLDRAEWRCALAPVPGAAADAADREAYRRKTRAFFEAFDMLRASAPFPIDQPEEAPPFERIVVGSDEVWNLRHPWYGGQSIFYGDGLRGERIAYAASFGNQDGAGLEAYWANLLKSFSAIAVRDGNSRRIVSRSIDAEPPLVLDPCLQFPEAIEPARLDVGRPYLAVYGHSFPDWFGRAARDWAASRDLLLVSIGYRNDWADLQLIAAGPAEFAGLMAGATAVVTNFFHGCVFALLNERPLACAASAYRNNKVRDLLSVTGCPERLVATAQDEPRVGMLLERSPGPGAAAAIETMRAVSRDYLDHALH